MLNLTNPSWINSKGSRRTVNHDYCQVFLEAVWGVRQLYFAPFLMRSDILIKANAETSLAKKLYDIFSFFILNNTGFPIPFVGTGYNRSNTSYIKNCFCYSVQYDNSTNEFVLNGLEEGVGQPSASTVEIKASRFTVRTSQVSSVGIKWHGFN